MPEDLDSILRTAPKQSATASSLSPQPTVSISGASSDESRQISALLKRYKDAYLYARVVVGLGKFLKGFGVVLAVLIALAAFLLANAARVNPTVLLVVGIIQGSIVGVFFYISGVLVSAVGQILKASLDCAVNNSPFLTNMHRAKIMSLPEA
jgi:hypothetical protein